MPRVQKFLLSLVLMASIASTHAASEPLLPSNNSDAAAPTDLASEQKEDASNPTAINEQSLHPNDRFIRGEPFTRDQLLPDGRMITYYCTPCVRFGHSPSVWLEIKSAIS